MYVHRAVHIHNCGLCSYGLFCSNWAQGSKRTHFQKAGREKQWAKICQLPGAIGHFSLNRVHTSDWVRPRKQGKGTCFNLIEGLRGLQEQYMNKSVQ